MKYSMFIGRWQPRHDGHQWLIDQRLKELKNVYKTKVSKRMVKTNEGNIYTQGVDDALKVSALVKQIKELKEEVKFWKKLSRRL